MRMILLSLCFVFVLQSNLFAQSDTSAYEVQRNKINQLLEERSSRFGQYESSLGQRTGIFGLKTKRDMQFSNDILRQIVLTDNDIFSELKILLDYKDLEKKQVETRAVTVESRIDRFQSTITRLQQENERLRTESEKREISKERISVFQVILFIALLISLFYIYRLKKLPKTDKQSLKNT